MAFSEIYVDPSIAADSGAGTVGDPYGDLEYAIEQTTFDTTNGTRVNIKAGTDEVLAAALNTAMADTSVSVAWAPSETARAVFQGYTSSAGDGGIGGISGGGTVGILAGGTNSYVSFIDLHLHNTGSTGIINASQMVNVIGCELDTSTGRGIDVDYRGTIANCYIHDITASYGILAGGLQHVANNYIDGTFTTAAIANAGINLRNIVVCRGTLGQGILINADAATVDHNSIYATDANTAAGVSVNSGVYLQSISNNLIEGFSGAGGDAVDFAGTGSVAVFSGNAYYDCANGFGAAGGAEFEHNTGNELLTASPFTAAATGDFSPVDTGSVKEGAIPQIIGGGLV